MSDARAGEDLAIAVGVHAAMWATGDYAQVASRLTPVSTVVVEMAAPTVGMRLLDMGAGSGTTAILAARAGARVVAGDLTADLFSICRERARDAGVDVDWTTLNPERLEFAPDSFDRVVSAVGAALALAPDQHRIAGELMRVCRPGGTLVVASWTAEGIVGRATRITAPYLGPAPEHGPSPWAWAGEESVRDLMKPYDVELHMERGRLELRYDSLESFMQSLEEIHGPTMMVKRIAEGQGRWPHLRSELAAVYDHANTSTDETLSFDQEYLLVSARKL